MRIRRAALAVVAIALLAAGCGDDRLTKEEYIAQADAICKEGNEKMLALAVPTGLEEVAELAGQAIEIQEQAVADLRALKPPEADEAILNEAYDLLDRQIEIGKQIQAAAEAADQAKIQELFPQIDSVNRQATQIAKDYGLVECGRE